MTKMTKGKPYPVSHPEWFVQCAARGCTADILLAPIGVASSADSASSVARCAQLSHPRLAIALWTCEDDGRWFCPEHSGT